VGSIGGGFMLDKWPHHGNKFMAISCFMLAAQALYFPLISGLVELGVLNAV